MAKRGRRVVFHGAFTHKTQAERKRRAVDEFLRRARIRGHLRYLVLTGRRR